MCIFALKRFLSISLPAYSGTASPHDICRGKSRSASVVLAYLMQKNSWSLERALKKVRARRECVAPHEGFLAQLKLYESMGHCIDGSNVQFKMFRDVHWTSFVAALCMFHLMGH